MTYLTRILEAKEEELALRRRTTALESLQDEALFHAARRPFVGALRAAELRVIAELKKASPSKGLIRTDFDVPLLARGYERGGAAALSVLTDERFFQGRLSYLADARCATGLPVLRKDFIIDRYQLHEARAYGADAVLLIVAALDRVRLADLLAEATALQLQVLCEVHTEAEVEQALGAGARCIGINNRDLHSFAVDLGITERLRRLLPPAVTVVSESGIVSAADVVRLRRAGVHAALIGEAFMREAEPGAALAALLRSAREGEA